MGFFRGIWLCWKNFVNLDIILNHPQFIHCWIDGQGVCKSFATFIYNSLTHVIAQTRLPWILVGDLIPTCNLMRREEDSQLPMDVHSLWIFWLITN
ncbi:hypothetical protein ES319_D06G087100v1 [Gossypium barbadense]|uniref:Uncharacterized protein n=1 Tax=Gossypium barbadense TaxID=3634 RepID=A0A5J5QZD9_GOSBA|nr:hypothetical protein ES319_D06G087100v1 [Gossypium barbadense]